MGYETPLLDEVIEKKRQTREERRLRLVEKILAALDGLSREAAFEEAWLFGSVTKPFEFSERSDIDIAFVGLDDRDFFRAMSYLSNAADCDVDVLQLEHHRLADKIKTGGIRWKRRE